MSFNTVWKTMDNYHLNRIAALGIAAEEMLQFGEDYAAKVCANSRNLGMELDSEGINVKYHSWFSYSHQIHLSPENNDVFGDFYTISKKLEERGIIVDREGRIGTAEITRKGINEMGEIASLIKDALNEKDVKGKVEEIRAKMKIKYCW
jgi:glycine hydroxymethyltransferase